MILRKASISHGTTQRTRPCLLLKSTSPLSAHVYPPCVRFWRCSCQHTSLRQHNIPTFQESLTWTDLGLGRRRTQAPTAKPAATPQGNSLTHQPHTTFLGLVPLKRIVPAYRGHLLLSRLTVPACHERRPLKITNPTCHAHRLLTPIDLAYHVRPLLKAIIDSPSHEQ